jgi:Ca2+-binding EF-hand superfamily protein
MAESTSSINNIPISKLREAFDKYDTNSSNSLSFDEIHAMCKEAFGKTINLEEIQALFKKIDQDKDNEISFAEFVAWWRVGRMHSKRSWMVKNYLKVVHGIDSFDKGVEKLNSEIDAEA